MTRLSDEQIAEFDPIDLLRETQQRMEDYARLANGGLNCPTRGRMLTHAVLQGAYAAEVDAAKFRDNPYETYDYRWAWMTGFDLGRRIDRAHKIIRMCGDAMEREISATEELQTLRQQLAALRDNLQSESRLAVQRSLSEYIQGECFAKNAVANKLDSILAQTGGAS